MLAPRPYRHARQREGSAATSGIALVVYCVLLVALLATGVIQWLINWILIIILVDAICFALFVMQLFGKA